MNPSEVEETISTQRPTAVSKSFLFCRVDDRRRGFSDGSQTGAKGR